MPIAELASLYRRIEEGDVDLVSAPEPEPQVQGLSPFFGCDPAWTPAREFATLPIEWCCLLATREVCIVDVCRVCYSGYGDTAIPESLVCMGACRRSRLDDRIEAILRDHPPPRHGEMGPREKAEADAARAARRKAAEKAAKAKARSGTAAYLYREPASR